MPAKSPELGVRLPRVNGAAPTQDDEWCHVLIDGELRRIRFHDYGDIYHVPGLYELIFYEHLKCTSPRVVARLLRRELRRADVDPGSLRGLDVGAGNGMVGEELAKLGVGSQVGVDLLQDAADAAERDRPGLYTDYLVCDLTDLDPTERRRLESPAPNLLITVAALGFGDIPREAFMTAYNMIADGGWIAFNIKADFLADNDASGFAGLVRGMRADGVLEERARLTYDHRLSIDGRALKYVAIVGVKRADATIGPVERNRKGTRDQGSRRVD
jgi:SAM-dependent methyltransferase